MTESEHRRSWAGKETLLVRTAVRDALADLARGDRVLVACSGGPDSLALAAAAAFVGSSRGLAVGAVVVDHQLQDSSGEVAAAASQACAALGLDPVVVGRVEVTGGGGPEAAARMARYELLEAKAIQARAQAVLLGHTREDQAETVLLRMARGSGTRTLAAMQPVSGLWRRPLLGIPRAVVHASAREVTGALGSTPWQDPHNSDPSFARVRVRTALDILEAALGPGLVAGLARTAELARDDAEALEQWAGAEYARLVTRNASGASCAVEDLIALPRAIRSRVLRTMCREVGAPGDSVTAGLVAAVDALVTDWHGQGEVSLPARVKARRMYGRLHLTDPVADAGDPIAT